MYVVEDSDIFKIFAHVITEGMTKEDLRGRVLELEQKNEKLHESVAKLQMLQVNYIYMYIYIYIYIKYQCMTP